MRYSILFSILLIGLFSCNKNKYNTIPSLKLTSVNNSVLHAGDMLIIRLAFTDAEGDLSADSALFVQEKVLNCTVAGSGFKQPYALPAFPTTKNQDGDIIVTYGYKVNGIQDVSNPRCFKNDTVVFRFALRDNARHTSDTVVTDKIVITF